MSWREREDDGDGDGDDLGLTLSLQLKCFSQKIPQHKPSLNGIAFQFSSAPRPITILEMNMLSSSSPDSTISNGNRKRSEREETGSEPHSSSSEGGPNDDSTARKKLRLTKEQTALLEETFKQHNTPNQSQKVALASQLNLQTRQVEVWFQNRRARTKSRKKEADCAYLKRVFQDLRDENFRLQKEVAELKALKYSPGATPPTTISMCPQCERLSMGSKLSSAPPFASGTSTQRHISASGLLDQTTPKTRHWIFSKHRGN